MTIPSHSAHASLAALIEESSLRVHIILESLIQAGPPLSGKSLAELVCYVETAWIVARQILKSPPKVLARSREMLRAWQNGSADIEMDEVLRILCGAVGAADAIWRRAPGTMLLDAMMLLRGRLAEE